jgi:hypothetical protein
VRKHLGAIVNTVGAAITTAFNEPRDGLMCAVEFRHIFATFFPLFDGKAALVTYRVQALAATRLAMR